MATRFPTVTQQEIEQIKEDSIPQKTREATKYGVKIFQGKHLTLWWVIVNKKEYFYGICAIALIIFLYKIYKSKYLFSQQIGSNSKMNFRRHLKQWKLTKWINACPNFMYQQGEKMGVFTKKLVFCQYGLPSTAI